MELFKIYVLELGPNGIIVKAYVLEASAFSCPFLRCFQNLRVGANCLFCSVFLPELMFCEIYVLELFRVAGLRAGTYCCKIFVQSLRAGNPAWCCSLSDTLSGHKATLVSVATCFLEYCKNLSIPMRKYMFRKAK